MTADDNDASRGLGCALTLTLAVLVAGAMYLLLVPVVAQGDDGEEERTREYSEQHHVGAHTGQEDGCVIWAIDALCVPIPAGMARDVVAVAQCESRWDVGAVGAAGEHGLLQVHPIHAGPMARAGLDYGAEGDRLRWAVRMWEGSGWRPWSCGR